MMADLQRAVTLLQSGQPAEAEQLLTTILASHPHQADALHLRGMARGNMGQFEAGEADLMEASKNHPQRHAVLNNLGNLRLRSGDAESAAAAYRSAIEVRPDFADARLNLGLALDRAGQANDAIEVLEALIARHPGHVMAHNALGNARLAIDDEAGALEAFDQALRLEPAAHLVRVNRGALLRGMGRAEASLADLDEACRQQPGFAEAQFQRGHTLRTLNRPQDAREAYLAAMRAAPTRADIHKDLAGLLWESGAGDGATAYLEEALEAHPDPELAYVLARVRMRTGQVDRGRIAADRAVNLDAGHARARALRGELRGLSGDRAGALEDIEAAFEASGRSDFEIRHQLVEACLATSRFEQALSLLQSEPPKPHLQKHVALKSLAWRAMDDVRYRYFYDYDRMTAKIRIETPPGFDSLDAFNAELADRLERLHATEAQPLEQTLFGGTQSPGRLWDTDDPVIGALGDALLKAASQFVAGLPDDPVHPFLRRKSADLELTGAWSVRLRSGGGHVDHIHPAGWISASYYVCVPQSVRDGERAGWLRLGASGVAGLELPAERYICPEPGHAIFFPSYMWHGVEPFESDEVRVTAPFDLVPAETR